MKVNLFCSTCNVVMAQRHFSCVLSRTDNLSSLTKHLMRGFTPEILLKTRILAKVEASNHTVNPDWNFGENAIFCKKCHEFVSSSYVCAHR